MEKILHAGELLFYTLLLIVILLGILSRRSKKAGDLSTTEPIKGSDANSNGEKSDESGRVVTEDDGADDDDESEERDSDLKQEVAEIVLGAAKRVTKKPLSRMKQKWIQFRSTSGREKTKIVGRFGVQIVVLLLLLYVVFPVHFSRWVYQGMILNIFLVIPLSTFLVGLILVLYQYHLKKKSRAVVTGMATLLAASALYTLVTSGDEWRTAMRYTFAPTQGLPEIDPKGVRFTPFDVAYNDMIQKFGSAEFSLSRARMHAVDIDGSVGFVAPITPEGVFGTFFWKQDGFMKFSDLPSLSQTDRVSRVPQKFHIGEGMLILDDVWRALYLRDPFCLYPEIYYLQISEDEFVGVAPKVRYSYQFPCFWVPYWAGNTIVHADGKIESLTKDEAIADSRFKGKRLFPQALARTIVDAQRFDEGLVSGLYQRPGLIRVPVLPGGQQMPYLYRTEDQRDLYVVATEPAGNSSALFRMYMLDAHSGDREVWELDPAKGILGPDRAGERVKSISGYTWGVTHELLESFPIPRDGKLFWKYTASVASRTGITFTAVVDTTDGEVEVFHTREAFDDWLAGRKREKAGVSPEMEQEIQELKKLLNEALKQVERFSS